MREKYVGGIIVAIAAAGLGGCGLFGSTGPTIKTWVEAAPSVNFQSPVTKSGLTVEVEAIDEGNREDYPRLQGEIDWTNPNFNPPKEGTETLCVFGEMPIAFLLKIANKTGHVIKFTGAVVKLIDAAGNIYDPMTKEDLEANWMAMEGKKLGAGSKITSVNRMLAVVKKLKMLDANTEILPDCVFR